MQHNNSTCAEHKTCVYLAKKNAARSAAVADILFYQNGIDAWVLGIGRETGGSYAGQFNLCAGKGEAIDNNSSGHFCWLRCARRELKEELKIDAPFTNGVFDSFFRGSDGRIRVFLHKRTPVFVGVLPVGTSRKTINARMQADNANHALSHAYKEMDVFEYIRLDNGQQIDGKSIRVSSFADGVRKVIDVAKL